MMGGYFVLMLLVLVVDGVFSVEVKRLTVMEGDSVTLNPDVPKQQNDTARWYFNDIRIAHVNGDSSKNCLYDGEGGIFRDRLEVNYETGSLTITNTRSEHAGHYKLEITKSEGKATITSLNRNRNSKCDSTAINKLSSDDDVIKTFSVIISEAEKKALPRADNMIPGSAQSPVGKAGIFVGVVAVAVVLLV